MIVRRLLARRFHTKAAAEFFDDGRVHTGLSQRAREIEELRGSIATQKMRAGPAFTRANVLYEDDRVMIVNKPAGILNEHVLATASHLLGAPYIPCFPPVKYPNSIYIRQFPHVVNLLSRDTSGANLILKRTCANGISPAKLLPGESSAVEKTYLVLCAATCGELPSCSKVRVESGHGRSTAKTWWVYPKQDVGKLVKDASSFVNEVATDFSILGCCQPGTGGEATFWRPARGRDSFRLVRAGETPAAAVPVMEEGSGGEALLRTSVFVCKPDQIRLHCQYLGLPLVGDVKYGGPLVWNGATYRHFAMHVASLTLEHSRTSGSIRVKAPAPEWAEKFALAS